MTIAKFLLELATNEGLLRDFTANAESVVNDSRYGLSGAQRQLLLSGDLRELRVEIIAKFEIEGEIVAFGTVYVPPITVYETEDEVEGT